MFTPRRLLAVIVPAALAVVIGAWNFAPTDTIARQAQPAPKTIVFRNATLYTATGDKPITDGVLVVKGGKIEAVGAKADVGPTPDDAEQVDLGGAVVIPGMVDTHSHIGGWGRPGVAANVDLNETSGPVQPGLRALDAVNPDDPGIRMATAGGITTANIMPGSANVIGGQTVYVKLRGGTVEEMRLTGRTVDGKEILGGMKMANGENPKGYGKNRQQAPFTRMKVAALQRETFQKAKEYKAKLDAGGKVERDLSLEPLVEVLERKRTVHFHTHRADDLMTAVRIAEEFGFELVIQHGTEGYRVADTLAKKKIPVSLTLVDSPGGKAETIGVLDENAAILEKAGVAVAINTDDSITESRFFLRTGAIAVRGGMSEMSALKALTITPAKLMHLDHRIGSLEKGKDADFVILSGRPFSAYTRVLKTYIDGKKVFDEATDRAYREGGFALAAGEKLPQLRYGVAAVPAGTVLTGLVGGQATTFDATRDKNSQWLAVVADRLYRCVDRDRSKGGLGQLEVESNVVVVIKNGKIEYVGPAESVKLVGIETVRAKHVTPGLIDPYCVAGLTGAWNIPADQDQDELSDPNQADLRVFDGFNPREPLLDFLQANGVTVVHTTPGRQNAIAGQSGVFRTDGATVESAAIKPVAAILVNLGEAPKEAYKGKAPLTRMATAALIRKAFADAQEYRTKKKNPGANTPGSPKLEALVPALEGKVPVYFAAHRKDDIQTALRIADEFKLKPVIALATEAYRMADELKKAGVPVVVHPTMQRAASSMETLNAFVGNAAVLADAGVPVCLGTGFEGYVPKVRVLRNEMIVAATAGGLGTERALKAATIDAAKLLGIADKYGSIEKGKVADLVLYDGDPFEHTTHVSRTLMAGRVVYNRDDYLKLPFERRILPVVAGGAGVGCCMSGW
jgi:imidazolonepropionase-like amidohydrolase